jgi:hypothetical protein
MAWYKNEHYLQKSNGDAYDYEYEPGVAAPHAGIYRCMGCHREVGIAQGHILPPQSHHQHSPSQGKIRWRLIVYADHEPK